MGCDISVNGCNEVDLIMVEAFAAIATKGKRIIIFTDIIAIIFFVEKYTAENKTAE